MRFRLVLFICFIGLFPLYAQQGEQYELVEIKFEGNHTFANSTLKEVIYSEETPNWFYQFLDTFTPFGAGPTYFDSSSMRIDIESMEEYYKTHGFFEAKFSSEYSVDTTEKEVVLLYKIVEGDPSNYGIVEVTGLDSIEEKYHNELKELITIDSSEVFTQDVIEVEANSVITSMMNNGYMLAKFDSTIVIRDTADDRANVSIYFTSGRKYMIDTVIIEKSGNGADRISDELIRDITDIEHGEVYSYEKNKRRQGSLTRTGIFNSISIQPELKDTSGNFVPLKLTGSIGDLNELSPEFIINNQQSAFNVGLGASYIRKNFLGNARKLTGKASFGIQDIFNADFSHLFRRFSFRDTVLLGYFEGIVSISQPDMFEKPVFGTLDNYIRIQKLRRLNTTTYGSKITFDIEMPTYAFVNFLSTYYNIEQVNEVYRNYNDSISRKLISVIGLDIGKTTADDLLFPTEGYNVTLQLEEANSLPHLISKIIGQNFDGSLFYKAVISSAYYLAVDSKRDAIAATKLKLGHVQPYHGPFRNIPNNRTLYTGGSNSIRGWRSNQLPGLEIKGGGFLLEGSLEFRYRFIQEFGMAVFFDYGNTWGKHSLFRFDEIALSPGFGFRYYSTVAPFRLDFGLKLYDPKDKMYIFKKNFWDNIEFHFGIGEAF